MNKATLGIYNLLYVNDIFDFVLTDFSGVLKKEHYCGRQSVKKKYKELRKLVNGYNEILSKTLGSKLEEFMDQSDYFYEARRGSLDEAIESIHRTFRGTYPEGTVEILSWMFVVGNLLTYINRLYMRWARYYSSMGKPGGIEWLSLSEVTKRYDLLVKEIAGAIGYMNAPVDDREMTTKFSEFLTSIGDENNVVEAARNGRKDKVLEGRAC